MAPEAHAILILDKAGQQTKVLLTLRANISLLPLPPRCPELNPTKNIWQHRRDNSLSNLVFDSYDAILTHRREAWKKLVAAPETITSIGKQAWARTSGSAQLGIAWAELPPAGSRYLHRQSRNLMIHATAASPPAASGR